MRHFRKIIFAFLIIIFIGQLLFRIFSYLENYTTRFDPSYWKARYSSSQWIAQVGCGDFNPHINPKTCVWDDAWFEANKNKQIKKQQEPIGDDGIYTYAAWEYIHGLNPILLNAEIPPLGKYIIGVGEITFNNQNILILIVGILCLFVFYLLNLKLFKDKITAFIPVFLFSLDPLFYTQLRAPLLFAFYLLFLLLTLYFTISRKYLLSGIFLGCFASVKFPLSSFFLVLPLILWVILYNKKDIKRFLLSLTLWPVVFMLSYLAFFFHGGTPFKLMGVQKWIISFYSQGAKPIFGIVFPMILFGSWNTWFSGIQKTTEWMIFWPVSLIGSVFAAIPLSRGLYLHIKKKNKKETPGVENFMLILFWVVSYLVILSFTPVFPRYLLLLLPFMYNLTVWFLIKYVFPRLS